MMQKEMKKYFLVLAFNNLTNLCRNGSMYFKDKKRFFFIKKITSCNQRGKLLKVIWKLGLVNKKQCH